MPFDKVGKNDYTGPSGKHFNLNQVRLYYARGGHFAEGGPVPMDKFSSKPKTARYAKGGPVMGKESAFMKTTDEFRDPDEGNPNADADQMYGKSGPGAGKGFIKPDAPRQNKKIK